MSFHKLFLSCLVLLAGTGCSVPRFPENEEPLFPPATPFATEEETRAWENVLNAYSPHLPAAEVPEEYRLADPYTWDKIMQARRFILTNQALASDLWESEAVLDAVYGIGSSIPMVGAHSSNPGIKMGYSSYYQALVVLPSAIAAEHPHAVSIALIHEMTHHVYQRKLAQRYGYDSRLVVIVNALCRNVAHYETLATEALAYRNSARWSKRIYGNVDRKFLLDGALDMDGQPRDTYQFARTLRQAYIQEDEALPPAILPAMTRNCGAPMALSGPSRGWRVFPWDPDPTFLKPIMAAAGPP